MEERAVHTIQKHWRLSRARTAGDALLNRLPLELLVNLAYLLQLPKTLRADTSVLLHGETTCLRETSYGDLVEHAGTDSPLCAEYLLFVMLE